MALPFLVLSLAPLAAGLGQTPVIRFTGVPDALQLAGASISAPQILVSSNDYWGVIRAAGDLAADFGRVTGTNFTLSNGEAGAAPATYTYAPVAANYTHVSDTKRRTKRCAMRYPLPPRGRRPATLAR